MLLIKNACIINRETFVSLLRKLKKKHYKDLNLSGVNEKFWENVKRLFGKKANGNNPIILKRLMNSL